MKLNVYICIHVDIYQLRSYHGTDEMTYFITNVVVDRRESQRIQIQNIIE
jgi:hypothetical protein